MSTNKVNFIKQWIDNVAHRSIKGRKSYRDIKISELELRVSNTGNKVFYLNKRVNNKPTRIKIGKFPDLSVKNARNKALELLSLIAQGNNPNADKAIDRKKINFSTMF